MRTDRAAGLNGTVLKLIAMTSMVLDHVGDNFFPDQVWMRIMGRIAMPIFAFCVSEGFRRTRDKRKYLMRMLLFGVISEIPFDLVTSGKLLEHSHQNIMLTFSWAILGLACCERILSRGESRWRYPAAVTAALFFAVSSVFLGLDYSVLATALIFTWYLMKDRPLWAGTAAAAAVHAALRNMGIYWFGLLGFVPVIFYNGERGRGLKWLFYLFYPGHLLLIFLIRQITA